MKSVYFRMIICFLIITIRKYLKSVNIKALYFHQSSIWWRPPELIILNKVTSQSSKLEFLLWETVNRSHSRTQSSVCNRTRLSVWDGSPPAAGKTMGAGGASNRCRCSLSFAACQRKGHQRPAEQPSIAHAKHGSIYSNMEHCISGTPCWRLLQECVHRCVTWQVPGCAHAPLCTFTYLVHVGGICCPAVSDISVWCFSIIHHVPFCLHKSKCVSPWKQTGVSNRGGVSFCVAKPDTYVLCAGRFRRDNTK